MVLLVLFLGMRGGQVRVSRWQCRLGLCLPEADVLRNDPAEDSRPELTWIGRLLGTIMRLLLVFVTSAQPSAGKIGSFGAHPQQ